MPRPAQRDRAVTAPSSDFKTLLGFDFGLKRIGVAVAQTITRTAAPLTTVRAQRGQPEWAEVDKLLQQWRPQALVVGRPTHREGGAEHEMTPHVEAFVQALAARYHLPILRVDEYLSSYAAESALAEREHGRKRRDREQIDSMAATVILQTWLNEGDKHTP